MIGYFVREELDEHGIRFGWSIHRIDRRNDRHGSYVFSYVNAGSSYTVGSYMRDVQKGRAVADAKRLAALHKVPYLGVLSGGDPPK